MKQTKACAITSLNYFIILKVKFPFQDDSVGLSPVEERELNKALYASLHDSKRPRTPVDENDDDDQDNDESDADDDNGSEAPQLRKSTRTITPVTSYKAEVKSLSHSKPIKVLQKLKSLQANRRKIGLKSPGLRTTTSGLRLKRTQPGMKLKQRSRSLDLKSLKLKSPLRDKQRARSLLNVRAMEAKK